MVSAEDGDPILIAALKQKVTNKILFASEANHSVIRQAEAGTISEIVVIRQVNFALRKGVGGWEEEGTKRDTIK